MMTLNDDKKVDILLSALNERYQSIRAIRDRVQSVSLWVMGLLLGAAAWLAQSGKVLGGTERIPLLILVAAGVILLRRLYFADLEKGFNGQLRTAARLEEALGLFAPDTYGPSGQSIYPAAWVNAGQDGSQGEFFKSSYRLVYLSAAILVAAIVLGPLPL